MPKISVDAALRDKLVNVTDEVTLTGPDGKPLGSFMPYFIPQFDEEEMRRRVADTTSKRYTTAEVLAMLEKL